MEYNILGYTFSSFQIIAAVVVLFLLIAIVTIAIVHRNRARALEFRNRFGAEYDHAIQLHGSERKAQLKLAEREKRVEEMTIRDLGAIERERFVSDWKNLQSHFVDQPTSAVIEADNLVNAVLEARGYPKAGFEQRAADLSVHYPRVIESYRNAHSIATRNGQSEASTEELRTAMIHYREIFEDLVQGQRQTEIRTAV